MTPALARRPCLRGAFLGKYRRPPAVPGQLESVATGGNPAGNWVESSNANYNIFATCPQRLPRENAVRKLFSRRILRRGFSGPLILLAFHLST